MSGTVTITARVNADQAQRELNLLEREAGQLRTAFEGSSVALVRSSDSATTAIARQGVAMASTRDIASQMGTAFGINAAGGIMGMVAAAAVGYVGIDKLKQGCEFAVASAADLESSMKTLQVVTSRTGQSFDDAKDLVGKYSDAISSPAAAASAVRVFTTMNMSMAQQSKLITGIRDGLVAMGMDVNEQLPLMALAIKRQESQLLDNMGVTKTIEMMYKEYAATLGITADKLTQVQKEQAVVNGVLEETSKYTGLAQDATDTYKGSVNNLKAAQLGLATGIGEQLNPSLTGLNNWLANVIRGLDGARDAMAEFQAQTGGGNWRAPVAPVAPDASNALPMFPGVPGAGLFKGNLSPITDSIHNQLPKSFAAMSKDALNSEIALHTESKTKTREHLASVRAAHQNHQRDLTADAKREAERRHEELLRSERTFLDKKARQEFEINRVYRGGDAGEYAALQRAKERLLVSTLPIAEVREKVADIELKQADLRISKEEQGAKDLEKARQDSDERRLDAIDEAGRLQRQQWAEEDRAAEALFLKRKKKEQDLIEMRLDGYRAAADFVKGIASGDLAGGSKSAVAGIGSMASRGLGAEETFGVSLWTEGVTWMIDGASKTGDGLRELAGKINDMTDPVKKANDQTLKEIQVRNDLIKTMQDEADLARQKNIHNIDILGRAELDLGSKKFDNSLAEQVNAGGITQAQADFKGDLRDKLEGILPELIEGLGDGIVAGRTTYKTSTDLLNQLTEHPENAASILGYAPGWSSSADTNLIRAIDMLAQLAKEDQSRVVPGSSAQNPSYTQIVNVKDFFGFTTKDSYFRGTAPDTRRANDGRSLNSRSA